MQIIKKIKFLTKHFTYRCTIPPKYTSQVDFKPKMLCYAVKKIQGRLRNAKNKIKTNILHVSALADNVLNTMSITLIEGLAIIRIITIVSVATDSTLSSDRLLHTNNLKQQF